MCSSRRRCPAACRARSESLRSADRVPQPLALVERLDELGGVAGALGRLARPVQQGVIARGDPSGQPTIGLAFRAAHLFVQSLGRHRRRDRRLCTPPAEGFENVEVSRRVHRVADAVARRALNRLQLGVDPARYRAEHQLRWQLVERGSESAALHLAVADSADQAREPPEFLLDTPARGPLEQLAENP